MSTNRVSLDVLSDPTPPAVRRRHAPTAHRAAAGGNADIVADGPVEVVMIPGDCNATTWLCPYGPAELRAALRRREVPVT